MSDTDNASWLKRVLWPDLKPVSESDRQLAAARFTQAQAASLITEDQLRERQELASTARTRADLRSLTKGLPGAASAGLLAIRQVITGLWLGLNAVQIVVWALVCIIGAHFANPWWLWSLIGGLIIVVPLWWFADAEFRNKNNNALNGEGLSTT